jgi:PTH1 family peptidyl-tRNA hydrolase
MGLTPSVKRFAVEKKLHQWKTALLFYFFTVHCAHSIHMSWVICGLGNPGEEYNATRHNAGRMAVEFFAEKNGMNGFREDKAKKATVGAGLVAKKAVALVLPDTFMNKSGLAVSKFVKSQKAAEQLIIVYDDLDLPIGKMKISYDRSSGGHKGLESIIAAVKTQKFTRVRIGVSPATAAGKIKKPEGKKVVNDFILHTFKPSEMTELKSVFKKAADALTCIVTEGRERAMNAFN